MKQTIKAVETSNVVKAKTNCGKCETPIVKFVDAPKEEYSNHMVECPKCSTLKQIKIKPLIFREYEAKEIAKSGSKLVKRNGEIMKSMNKKEHRALFDD